MRTIAGDIGGTKTLLRCLDGGVVCAEARYDSQEWRSFDDVLRAFLTGVPGRVDSACFAVAGPVLDARAEVTNVGWVIDRANLARAFEIGRVALINDFHAVALGVPLLKEADLVSLQSATRDAAAPIAILGAGTGLGEAILLKDGESYRVVPTEGGHADFAPQDEEQSRLFLDLHRKLGHVSWERVVSGMGLVNIHTFLGGEELTPPEIAERAAAGDRRASHTFEIFIDCYGAEAGNLALKTLPRGGVFLAGGIAAKNITRLASGRFIDAFRRKGRFAELMTTFPVDIIVNEEVGLMGAMWRAGRQDPTTNVQC